MRQANPHNESTINLGLLYQVTTYRIGAGLFLGSVCSTYTSANKCMYKYMPKTCLKLVKQKAHIQNCFILLNKIKHFIPNIKIF